MPRGKTKKNRIELYARECIRPYDGKYSCFLVRSGPSNYYYYYYKGERGEPEIMSMSPVFVCVSFAVFIYLFILEKKESARSTEINERIP